MQMTPDSTKPYHWETCSTHTLYINYQSFYQSFVLASEAL